MSGDSAGIPSGCQRCRRFAILLTDGFLLTEIQIRLIQIIHRGHQ